MLSGLRSFHMGRQPQSIIRVASLRTSYLYLHDPWATSLPHANGRVTLLSDRTEAQAVVCDVVIKRTAPEQSFQGSPSSTVMCPGSP